MITYVEYLRVLSIVDTFNGENADTIVSNIDAHTDDVVVKSKNQFRFVICNLYASSEMCVHNFKRVQRVNKLSDNIFFMFHITFFEFMLKKLVHHVLQSDDPIKVLKRCIVEYKSKFDFNIQESFFDTAKDFIQCNKAMYIKILVYINALCKLCKHGLKRRPIVCCYVADLDLCSRVHTLCFDCIQQCVPFMCMYKQNKEYTNCYTMIL